MKNPLSDQNVQCMSDLPTECDETVGANRGTVSCALLEERFQKSNYTTSVPDGTGSDWVLILYGEDNNPDDERQFVPTTEGVSLTEYENGTALVTGQVVDVDDPTAILNIQTIFGQGVLGSDWPGSFKSANNCQIPSNGNTTTESWNIYQMETGLSYLTGEGSLDGSYVQMAHMPGINPGISVPNYGFQVGTGANNRSCELGAGGWFYYSGMLDGEQVENGTGDISLDLTTNFQTLNPCNEDGESTVTLVYTIQDLACGQVLTEDQVFTRIDNTTPIFDNAPADVSIDCTDDIPDAPTVTASDNCADSGFPTVTGPTENTIPGSCPQEYTIVRQWIAEDCSGNQTAHTQNISVEDNTGPTIVGGGPSTVECDGSGNTTELDFWLDSNGGATATDDCGTVTWSHDFTALSDDCGETGSANVTFTATDDCLNESTITLTFTIIDTTDPTWENSFGFTTAACEDLTDPTDPSQVPFEGASDFCSDVTYSIEAHTFSGGCPNSYQRIWTAIDACGNESAVAEQYVELYDNELPVITLTCPADYTADAADDCTAPIDTATTGAATATASDNCATDLEIAITYSDGPETNACVGQRTFTRTWSASTQDDCDNVGTATCSQVITINDNTDPELLTMAMDSTTECDGFGNNEQFYAWLANAGGAVATDGCSDVTWSNDYASYQPADAGFSGTYDEDSWTILNDGAPSEVSFSVDGTEIHFDGPLDSQFGPGGGVGVVKACQPARARLSVSFDWAYELNTSWPNTGSLLDPAFYINDSPTTLSGWSWGNTTQNGSMTMIVETGDEFGWGIASYILGGLGNAELTISNFSTQVLQSQDPCNDEQRIVTFTASDDCGNNTSTTASFFIEDTTPPSISSDPLVNVPCDEWSCDADALEEMGLFTVTDVCNDYTLEATCVANSGDCVLPIAGYTVNIVATDACGNASDSYELLVNLTDDEAPVPSITCPADKEVFVDASCMADLDPSNTGNAITSATDNCDSDPSLDLTYTDGESSPICEGSYSFDRTFKLVAEDNCGNSDSTTCVQTITVTDNVGPIISGGSPSTVECDGSGNSVELTHWLNTQGGATASDPCSDVTWSNDFSSLSDECGETGMATVTFTAKDDCLNSSTLTLTFTIEDTTPPSMDTEASDETVECDGSGNTAALNAWLASNGGAMASDFCSGVTWTNDYSALSDDCGATGSALVTFTATDACLLTTTTTATFTIEDTTAPSMDTEASDETVECDGSGNTVALNAWLASNGGAIASDDCGGVTWTNDYSALSDDCGATGSALVTFTATDACLLTTTTTATFTIEDTTAPTMDTEASDETAECDGSGNLTELNAWLNNYGGASASDDCSSVTWSNNYDADCDGSAESFLNYKQQDWGKSTSGAASDLLDADFDAVFPDGVKVGCGDGYELVFTTADAVDTYLPCTGGAQDLTLSHGGTNPTADSDPSCWDNALVTHVLTAKLNVAFDAADPAFSPSDIALGDLIAVDGPFYGMSINDIIAISDLVLGDCSEAYTPQECRVALRAFNKNYRNGSVDLGYTYIAGCFTDECGATGSAIVTFTASDDCGLMTSTTATFTIEDNYGPEITADIEVDVACEDYDAETPFGYSVTDDCSDVTTVISDLMQSGVCGGVYQRTYTATDECGHESTWSQTVTLTDDEDPTFDLHCPQAIINISADAADCSADTTVATHGSATFSNVADNCDTDVDMEVSHEDSQVDGCAGSYVITRVWTVTATDHCDNETTKTCTQTITVTDDTDPTITNHATGSTVECDGEGNADELAAWLANNGGATATDACGEVTWSNNHSELSDDCGATGSTTVIFTATDECDNTSETTATFTIQDTTDPSLTIEGPANVDLYVDASCYVDTTVATIGGITYGASDICGDVEVVVTSVDGEISQACADTDETLEGSYSFARTFTATATDDCNRTTTETYVQTITVSDTISPQFTNTCGLTNDDDVPVCCTDLSGTVLIPEACEPSADDNCDSEVNIEFTEVYVGEYAPQPGSGVVSYCESSTPEAFEDGEACNGLDSHSFSLFNFDGELRVDFVSDGTGTVAQMENGTWVLTQDLLASTGGSIGLGGLSLSVTYGEAQSWEDWFVQGQTNYKRDCGDLIDDHENWDYRIMSGGTLTGTGDYAGLSLSLSHAPANEYYAFQVGVGANNQNNNYGYSGWVMASGTYNEESVFFSGDLFGDLDCCLPWSITRDYVASDDCANNTAFGYTVDVNAESCTEDDGPSVSGGQDGSHGPSVMGGAGDVLTGKSPIRVTNLMPNPTNDLSMLGFTVTQNMRLRVDMFTMDGVLVSQLYDGVASPNVNNTLNIEASDLQSGMYQIRLSSSEYLVVKKLLVTD